MNFVNFANLIVIQVTSVNFLFYETYGKVHEDFHVPFKTRKARYMEISMYLATKHMARYMEIYLYFTHKEASPHLMINWSSKSCEIQNLSIA